MTVDAFLKIGFMALVTLLLCMGFVSLITRRMPSKDEIKIISLCYCFAIIVAPCMIWLLGAIK